MASTAASSKRKRTKTDQSEEELLPKLALDISAQLTAAQTDLSKLQTCAFCVGALEQPLTLRCGHIMCYRHLSIVDKCPCDTCMDDNELGLWKELALKHPEQFINRHLAEVIRTKDIDVKMLNVQLCRARANFHFEHELEQLRKQRQL